MTCQTKQKIAIKLPSERRCSYCSTHTHTHITPSKRIAYLGIYSQYISSVHMVSCSTNAIIKKSVHLICCASKNWKVKQPKAKQMKKKTLYHKVEMCVCVWQEWGEEVSHFVVIWAYNNVSKIANSQPHCQPLHMQFFKIVIKVSCEIDKKKWISASLCALKLIEVTFWNADKCEAKVIAHTHT